MFQARQPSHPNFSNYSSNPNPTPNPIPALPYSAPTLHPPGTDQYATLSSYPYIHGGFQLPPAFHHDPNAISHNMVVPLAEQINYAPDINSFSGTAMTPTSLNPLWNNSWMNQHVVNNVMMKTTKPSKVIQSFRCEICKIDCNSKDVLEKHILGKKHKRNLQMQFVSPAALPNTSRTTQSGSLGEMVSGNSGFTIGGELEMKKQKLLKGGASVDSVMFCTICDVACNSQLVFNKHLAGRKHAAQATSRLLSGAGPFVGGNSNNMSLISPAVLPYNKGTQKKHPKKPKIVQSQWCEVCKISCNSSDVLSSHKLGKKHSSNLEKSKKTVGTPASTAALATTPIIGPMENPEATKSKIVDQHKSKRKAKPSEEDLETKRRKILENGAAAGVVRECNICNVVCNNHAVFNSHLAGQKHAAVLKKLAEGGTTASDPQVVNAT